MSPPAQKKARRPARKKAGSKTASAKTFPIEIDPKRIEETLRRIRGELSHWAKKGRYTRVRFKFRGKPLLPDLPLAAVVAAEGLTFYWGGILRALLFNLAGKTVFDVELVNDAEKRVHEGKDALLAGDLDAALEHFRAAVSMDRSHAGAHLNVGIALKLKNDLAGARAALEQAQALGGEGPVGVEAQRLLAQLKPRGVSQTAPQ